MNETKPDLEIRKEILGGWITGQGCQTTDEVMRVLDPLFEVIQEGSFSLGSAEELSEEEIRQAVSLATGKEVEKIVFQPISEPLPKLSHWIRFISPDEGEDLAKTLGNFRYQGLWGFILGYIGDPLRHSLGRNHKKDKRLWSDLVYGIGNSLNVDIFNYVALHLTGRPEEGKRFDLLLSLWPKCIPLAFKDDEPNTIIVIVD